MSKKPRKMSQEQVTKINELHATGMTTYQIAKTLSIPPGVAKYHIDRSKLRELSKKAPYAPPANTPPQKPAAPTNNAENFYKQELDKAYLQEIGRLKQQKKLLVEIISQL